MTKINLDELVPGKALCDMHDGLSTLEERIPGFVLLHNARIQTDTAHEIMDGLFMEDPDRLVCYFEHHNKMLYYYEQDINGLHKAVYQYDRRYFGIVTFRIETDAEKKLEKAFAKC